MSPYFRFLDNKEDIAKIRKCFAGLWSLDDKDIVKKAIETPDLFVMKPQREGGGRFHRLLNFPMWFALLFSFVAIKPLTKNSSISFREQYLWRWCEESPSKIAGGREWRRCCLHSYAEDIPICFPNDFSARRDLSQRPRNFRARYIRCLLKVCNPLVYNFFEIHWCAANQL